ncbi:MAG TPA: efflux RND transporter periplasmic adaptor subunit [Flavipsychrobacter sp.]|nr:efflux RND transporter periplasmic adaptor subunit [Flavipsychrobacter sp.]
MLNSRNNFFLFLGMVLFTMSCSSKKDNKQQGGGRPKDVKAIGYIVKPSSFEQTYKVAGTLLPNEAIEIHPELTGRITKIHFKEGAFVKKGQLLVSLYDADILAQIQKLKQQKALQNKLYERQQSLVAIGGISQQDYEATATTIATIDADITAQEAQLRRTKILAPFEGIVGIRSISEGAIVSPTTTIAQLQQVHPLKIDFNLPEQYYPYLKTDKAVYFSVKGVSDSLEGKISSIDPGADAATRTIRARAVVPNPNRKLIAGAYAEVTIPFESNNEALLIPTQSILLTTRDKKVVWVANGKATMKTVQLGVRSANKVEVLAGLKPGDTILTTGLMQVKDGMDVLITKTQE